MRPSHSYNEREAKVRERKSTQIQRKVKKRIKTQYQDAREKHIKHANKRNNSKEREKERRNNEEFKKCSTLAGETAETKQKLIKGKARNKMER